MNDNHHENWPIKNLNEISTIRYGKNLPTSEFIDIGFPVFGANGIIGKYSSYIYEDQQVLISCRGAYSGKINWSPPKSFITNNSLIVELNNEKLTNKRFIFYALQNVDKSKLVTGTAQPQVTLNNANVLRIPIPSIHIQERIVTKIEELFTQLDAGTSALKRVQAGLKRYKASVLKAAVEGRLLDTGSRKLDDGELPEGWKWVTVGQIGTKNEQTVLTGPFGSNLGREDFIDKGTPV